MLADAHRKAGQQRQADLLDILAGCTQEDICALFDSTAFNDIAKGYLQQACRELAAEETITEEQAKAVQRRYNVLFSEKRAKEILQF